MMPFIAVIIYLLLQTCLTWVIYQKLNNPIVVDVAWVVGLAVTGIIYILFNHFNTLTIVFSTLLVIWGLRLGSLLTWRVLRSYHDPRYEDLSNQWKINKSLGFFLNFLLQAGFIFIISLPFYFIAIRQNSFSALDIIAGCIVIASILGETVADYQLARFRKKHPGRVCNHGLWHYSRHPNYFFEWLVWLSFSLSALGHLWGWLGLFSPICLYFIMIKITIPITEKCSLESKGELYHDYMEKTPLFFPFKNL